MSQMLLFIIHQTDTRSVKCHGNMCKD